MMNGISGMTLNYYVTVFAFLAPCELVREASFLDSLLSNGKGLEVVASPQHMHFWY